MPIDVERTKLSGCVIITPKKFGDERGYFCEIYNRPQLAAMGVDVEFVQDNQSLSRHKGTLRGLHYQAPPFAQDKLVHVVAGRVLDVVVDVRPQSAHYGEWVSVELSAENGKQLFVPKGFLHGFLTLTNDVIVQYKVSDVYDAASDGAVRFDDPNLAIDWQWDGAILLSEKDQNAPLFKDWLNPFDEGAVR